MLTEMFAVVFFLTSQYCVRNHRRLPTYRHSAGVSSLGFAGIMKCLSLTRACSPLHLTGRVTSPVMLWAFFRDLKETPRDFLKMQRMYGPFTQLAARVRAGSLFDSESGDFYVPPTRIPFSVNSMLMLSENYSPEVVSCKLGRMFS
jgi:hypothetical protein